MEAVWMKHLLQRLPVMVASMVWLSGLSAGCVVPGGPNGNGNNNTNGSGVFNNTTDPTNRDASFIGSNACLACHADFRDAHELHGHSHALTPSNNAAPVVPAAAERAGVPNPPDGFAFADISYVLGGYTRKALFIDNAGFLLTNDATSVDTQWNLAIPATGRAAFFSPYEDEGHFSPDNPKPYPFECFACHTTAPQIQDTAHPQQQDGRAGILGTWREAGVQCETCHGPGSNHGGNTAARDLYVNRAAERCGTCHNAQYDSDDTTLRAANGFVATNSQYPELLASGGHAEFDCTICHDPHRSSNYDRQAAIIRDCTDCHGEVNHALHGGVVYVQGDYVEQVTCESCHMPFASAVGEPAGPELVGDQARIGDSRSHIFRIQSGVHNYTSMFTADGSQVRLDDEGRAAVTVDFICLRCHHGNGNAFSLTIRSAGEISVGMHGDGSASD